ncbi:hypothetical protein [Arthrobacter sp. M4]|uniref:hypothetical protein n=1 Tax=Arthrobacter sp. M4 TaxID=218160 RepID=UPI001CDBED95|nr:hypothetical protein [Arthrobacter sp. M4]MCA4133983.1 hypothetical protein [Arthrobacter sp. M4]
MSTRMKLSFELEVVGNGSGYGVVAVAVAVAAVVPDAVLAAVVAGELSGPAPKFEW